MLTRLDLVSHPEQCVTHNVGGIAFAHPGSNKLDHLLLLAPTCLVDQDTAVGVAAQGQRLVEVSVILGVEPFPRSLAHSVFSLVFLCGRL